MSDSLRNSIDTMLQQGASAGDILVMLAPRTMNDAAREVFEEVAAYLRTRETAERIGTK